MKRHRFVGETPVAVEDAEPECGEDFCDQCGDCLHCFGGDPCFDGNTTSPSHYWVVYGLPKPPAPRDGEQET
jgi:hypothetical protein